MAGDWIQMRVNLDTDPAVLEIAAQLNMEECLVVGRLWKLWSWADQHVKDCDHIDVTRTAIDRIVGVPGFADAMCKTTWLRGEDGDMAMPNLRRYIGNSAKKRAADRDRKALWRERQRHGDVTPKSRKSHASVPSESHAKPERREEKSNTPTVPKGDERDEGFAEFWAAYPKKANKQDALKAWRAAAPKRPDLSHLLAAIGHFMDSDQWGRDGGKFIPDAARWLRNERWLEASSNLDPQESEKKEKGGGAEDPPRKVWKPVFDGLRGEGEWVWQPEQFAEVRKEHPDLAAEILEILEAAGSWPIPQMEAA